MLFNIVDKLCTIMIEKLYMSEEIIYILKYSKKYNKIVIIHLFKSKQI